MIEVRFDFAPNTFHSGVVMLSEEFDRKTEPESETETASTYTKTLHFEDQKSVSFTIPYIYDTLLRISTNLNFNVYERKAVTADMKKHVLAITPGSFTRFKIVVLS